MKHRVRVLSFLISLLLILTFASSCEPDNNDIHSDTIEIVANNHSFLSGEAIRVMGWYNDNEPWKENPAQWWIDAVGTYDGAGWANYPAMCWRNNATNHFLAWYPVDFASGANNLTSVAFDILSASNPDIIWARKSYDYKGGDKKLILDFSHLMSQFEVRLLFKGKYKSAYDIVVTAPELYTSATIDMLDSQAPVIAELDAHNSFELAQKSGNDTVTCHYQTSDIVVPQQVSKLNISFKYGSGNAASFDYIHNGNLQLVSDSLHTLTLEVRNGQVNFREFSVTPWGVEAPHNCDLETDVDDTPYLTFSAEKEQTLSLKLNGGYVLDGTLEYSVNGGDWSALTASQSISFGAQKGSLRFRGASEGGMASSISKYAQIIFGNSTVPVVCSGDIRTLVDYENYYEAKTDKAQFCYLFRACTNLISTPELPSTELAERCYYGMFYGCTGLTTPPVLPATTMNVSCYYSMFYGCTSLTKAPELPAVSLAQMCYYNMFNGCTSLTDAPRLAAVKLAESCYSYMFAGCTNLTSAPELPALALEKSCYAYMFQNCKSLIKAPQINAATLAEKCCYYMFKDCTSLTQAPELDVKELVKSCYEYMFYGCSSLAKGPKLPASTLAARCYFGMFYNCKQLGSVTMLATDISASSSLTNWVKNVASEGTFTKASVMSSLPVGANGIPSGWSVADWVE